jgi:hypothetical protein
MKRNTRILNLFLLPIVFTLSLVGWILYFVGAKAEIKTAPIQEKTTKLQFGVLHPEEQSFNLTSKS